MFVKILRILFTASVLVKGFVFENIYYYLPTQKW